MRFAGKVAIVTGGASGIGRGTTEALVAAGGKVLIADIQDDRGRALKDRLGEQALYERCNVTNERDIARLVDAAVTQWGRLDLMFNNAAASGDMSAIADMSDEGWSRSHDILLRSAMLCTKHAARVMQGQQFGCILNTSSAGALLMGLAPPAYSVFKAAVNQLTKVTALELAKDNIRVNAISPGFIATPMQWVGTEVGDEERMTALVAEARSEAQPLRVGALPADIAEAVLYLACDSGRFVTGINLVIDGGLTLGKDSVGLDASQQKVRRIVTGE